MRLHNTRARLAVAKPLYSQVRDMVLSRIRNGEWKAGDTLPNEFVLASQCGVSVGTIRRAVEGLEESGIVVRKQGRGTYVTGFATKALEQKFCPLWWQNGERPHVRYELLGVTRRRCTSTDRDLLEDAESTEALEVRQLLSVPSGGIGLEISLLPAALFPRLEKHVVAGQHLYAVFGNYGILVTRADDSISLLRSDDETAALLGVQPGTALLSVERRTFAYDGRCVEWRRSLYRPDDLVYRAVIA